MSLLQQEQQGFFPSFPIISSQPRLNSGQNQKPYDNEPHVVVQSPIQFKLPSEILKPVTQIPRIPFIKQINEKSKRGSSLREQAKLRTFYEKYVKSCQFQLIYSKSNKMSLEIDQIHFAKRPIDLTNLLKFNINNYKSLKNYPQFNDFSVTDKNRVEQLCFGSHFQCGNLLYVFKSTKDYYTYDCIIENDTNTQGFNQWFYFSIKNLQRSIRYKFNIVNMTKRFSFYKGEMKPIIFSLQKHKRQQNGWYRRGYNVTYRSSDICLKQNERGRYYCLSFELDFDYESDFITICSSVPYSYSRLMKQLCVFKNEALDNNIYWHQKTICHTISCNQVPYLTITSQENQTIGKSQNKTKKNVIILLARQHPGQTNSSFLIQKILQIISKNSHPKIQWLLNKFQFRIFPMINVDGVIYGNNRCDLTGFDLNRCWRKPITQLHPHILSIKKQITSIHKTNEVVCCIDFHSHSKQFNVFSYCNKQDQIESRLFAMILSKYTKIFHFPSCTFGLSRQKQSTARAVIGSIINHYNVMTIQTSGYGFKIQDVVHPFKDKHFQDVAVAIISTLKTYFQPDKMRKNCLAEIRDNLSKFRAYCRKNWQINSGSDSESQSNMKSLQQRLGKVLTHQLIQDIKKRFKEPTPIICDPRPDPPESNMFEEEIDNDIFPRREKMLKIMLKNKKRSLISPQRKMIQLKKLPENEGKKKASIPAQLHLVHNVRLNRLSKQKVKTQPRAQDLYLADKNQGSFRYHTPNRGHFMNQQQFKKSMKFLYKQLTCLPKEDYRFRGEQGESQLIIASNKQLTERQKSNTGRLQKILKCRKKGSNFRISSIRDNQTIDEVTLLKIRSQHASLSEATIQRDLSPSANSKMEKLINHKQVLKGAYGDHYLTHLHFLNRFLRSNIRNTVIDQ